MMIALDVLNLMTNLARDYVKVGKATVLNNGHMNQLQADDPITQEQVEAVIVDFINYVGMSTGIDYGLYTADIQPVESKPFVPLDDSDLPF